MTADDDAFDPTMLDELRELSSADDDLLGRIIGIFRRDAPQRLADIREAHAAEDAEALHRASHTLKGAAGNLGLCELMRCCEVVVEATRTYELSPRSRGIDVDAIDAIDASIQRAVAYLAQVAST